jgi:hypothetical protein
MSTDCHVHDEVHHEHMWTIWLIIMEMVQVLFHLMPLHIHTFNSITNVIAMEMLKLEATLFIII